MSAALVVVATITLVIGLLGTGLTLIYVSIGCSVLAGIVLAVAVMRGRPEQAVSAPTMARPVVTPPTPASPPPPSSEWEPPRPGPAPESPAPAAPLSGGEEQPAGVGVAGDPSVAPAEVAHSSAVARLRERARARGERQATATEEKVAVPDSGDAAGTAVPPTGAPEVGGEGFPISDYDQLRASEILRRLPDLNAEELEAVRAHEAAGMNRFTVVSRIDAVLAESGHRWEVTEEEWSAEEEREKASEWAGQDDVEEWPEEAEEPAAPEPEAPAPAAADVLDFSFEEDYEPSAAAERLAARMAARRGAGADVEDAAARKSAARKTAAKRSAAKKAPAKKAPAKKAPARKAPAKRAPAKRAAASVAWVEPSGELCPPDHPVKAKVRSGIYHVEGGRDYERTAPDRCYRDEASAKRDGLRRAKR